ncbi:hypothetical protein YC2023_124522 [Brassica napus]
MLVEDATMHFGIKKVYHICYGPCDDKGVCEKYCQTKSGLIRGDCVGGTCCCVFCNPQRQEQYKD